MFCTRSSNNSNDSPTFSAVGERMRVRILKNIIEFFSRLANDRRSGRLRDSEILVDFRILVNRLLNYDRHVVHQDLAPEMEP